MSKGKEIIGEPLVINGRTVEYWGHPEVVQAIIKDEIQRSRK